MGVDSPFSHSCILWASFSIIYKVKYLNYFCYYLRIEFFFSRPSFFGFAPSDCDLFSVNDGRIANCPTYKKSRTLLMLSSPLLLLRLFSFANFKLLRLNFSLLYVVCHYYKSYCRTSIFHLLSFSI